ncbi:hypothetical protein [Absidia glauca]|uniref:Mitochondrial import inner membrane translocase subunit TIM54 n=1 Tax=Absidia glauca TaxID=4829 RepID=A0A163KVT8_ABSGL|nr:hypothetical protein [Absidia glauca]
MPLPFGFKAPSRGTLIFTGIVGSIGGSYFGSKYYSQQSRQALCDKVSWLADRPCGVHERPRKVQVFITAPPGDGLEKSRNWFGDYVKPVLVAAAIDYEVKESREPGQITAVVREQVIERRKAEQLERQTAMGSAEASTESTPGSNPFAPVMNDILKQQLAAQHDFDGVIAIGRNAWREVVNGLDQGCTVSLRQVALEEAEAERQKQQDEQQQQQQSEKEPDNANTEDTYQSSSNETTMESITMEQQQQQQDGLKSEVELMDDTPMATETSNSSDYPPEQVESMTTNGNNNSNDGFGVPASLSPIMYIPHENIIGWTNIPYRLYMWVVDYQRIERFGEDVVAVALNKTRPLQVDDLDVGHQEKKYWIGDDEAKTARDNDQPIQMDDKVRVELKTYAN